jgi:hypothetical protein
LDWVYRLWWLHGERLLEAVEGPIRRTREGGVNGSR